ncbi:MAG: AEC family transporter [Flavobacteriales bacterium]|nr:AEC family transporter [Flavobacteriales bacterium]
MDSLYLLVFCLIAGVLLQRVPSFPPNAAHTLNQYVLYAPLPALALYHVPEISGGIELLYPIAVAWICFLAAWLFFGAMRRSFGWSHKLTGCLILCAGLGNTSFVGFPVIEAAYGKEALGTALLVDQPGSFVVLSTLGLVVATVYSRQRTDTITMARKILLFPPFVGFAVAVLMNVLDLHFGEGVRGGLLRIGNSVTPVALLAVGLQLRIKKRSKHWGFLGLGLVYKLLLAPALIFLLYVVMLDGTGKVVRVSVLESAMAPMITAAILASTHGLKPRLANMMVGVGIPLSLLTLTAWYVVLEWI